MQENNNGKLNILVAVYGLKIVTEQINELIIDASTQTLSFKVNNKTIGEDGWVGQQKSLTIIYAYGDGDLHVAAAKEGDEILIHPGKHKSISTIKKDNEHATGLTVLAATYGVDDVTNKIRNSVSSYNTLSLKADNEIFGDSWYGVAKTLVIVLGIEKEVKAVEVYTEREKFYIDLNDAVPAI